VHPAAQKGQTDQGPIAAISLVSTLAGTHSASCDGPRLATRLAWAPPSTPPLPGTPTRRKRHVASRSRRAATLLYEATRAPLACPPAVVQCPGTRGFVVGAVVGIPRWHARGQGFKSPQLHHHHTAGQHHCAAIPSSPAEAMSPAWGRTGAASALSATPRHSSTAARTRACISGVRCR
jgi:hypothetical protein